MNEDDAKIYQWIMELVQGDRKEAALLELSKKREQVDDLAVILWHSVGGFPRAWETCWRWTALHG